MGGNSHVFSRHFCKAYRKRMLLAFSHNCLKIKKRTEKYTFPHYNATAKNKKLKSKLNSPKRELLPIKPSIKHRWLDSMLVGVQHWKLIGVTLTTGVSAPTSSSKAPPGEVRPGHIMFAPARTNFIAPPVYL